MNIFIYKRGTREDSRVSVREVRQFWIALLIRALDIEYLPVKIIAVLVTMVQRASLCRHQPCHLI